MAQAARLSLRMHKEVKLLVEDPPHGTSFPSLTDLFSLDALIEGPEGTVYAGGVFKIRVQIPERYPFHPPNVTFATPIYHPNIDTGGRICLDILNLPPKGGWQPSLNIWTVLTSIKLLLSEPNPDDGLMCEASKEFKYDRQAFDRKARSMTEKYARADLNCGSVDDHSLQPGSSHISMEGDETCRKSPDKLEDDKTASTKLGGVRRKLSLSSSSTMVNEHDGVSDPSPAISFLENPIDENLTRRDPLAWKDECVYDNPHEMQKLSCGSSKELMEDFDRSERNVLSRKNPIYSLSSGSINKLSVAKKGRLSLGVKGQLKRLQEDNKENIDPNMISKSSQIDQKAREKYGQVSLMNAHELDDEESGESLSPETVIVLDSEDSAEEADNSSVARKFLGQKRLANLRLKTGRMN